MGWLEWLDTVAYGPINAHFICPHCATTGSVRTKRQKRKRGISGGKAAGGVLTGGISILVTGISRKEWVTQAYCGTCRSLWDF
jgi:hypothetical protein